MAWRLDSSIVRGEIDNRTRDRVTGKIWLVGREYPIELTLDGNAMRDIAGCLLTFENHKPTAGEDTSLSPIQMGHTGEMTASRKVRVFDIPVSEALKRIERGEKVAEQMGNCLYLEWYSRADGRVVIESIDYAVSVEPHVWRMTTEEEIAQSKKNEESSIEWLEEITSELDDEEDMFDYDSWHMDEFEWEKQLKESDAMTDRYSELLEKYIETPDHEEIIAREMGWTSALDDEEEEEEESDEENWLSEIDIDDIPELVPNPLTEGRDWIRTENGRVKHPLSEKAFRVAMDMWHYSKDRELIGENGDEDLHDMIFQAQTLGAKLAGALDSLAYEDDPDGGFVVACLKRGLQFFDNAMRSADRVSGKDLLNADKLEQFRSDLFQIRQEMLRLMTYYRQLQ
jgi:hypothetical protein